MQHGNKTMCKKSQGFTSALQKQNSLQVLPLPLKKEKNESLLAWLSPCQG
jgi:hypothetical protein